MVYTVHTGGRGLPLKHPPYPLLPPPLFWFIFVKKFSEKNNTKKSSICKLRPNEGGGSGTCESLSGTEPNLLLAQKIFPGSYVEEVLTMLHLRLISLLGQCSVGTLLKWCREMLRGGIRGIKPRLDRIRSEKLASLDIMRVQLWSPLNTIVLSRTEGWPPMMPRDASRLIAEDFPA